MHASRGAGRAAQAILNIISNPVNSTVPIAAEVLKAAGVYKPSKCALLPAHRVQNSGLGVRGPAGAPVPCR